MDVLPIDVVISITAIRVIATTTNIPITSRSTTATSSVQLS